MSDSDDDLRPRFVTGGKPGPGRPKGSRNKLTEDFIAAVAESFEEGGREAIDKVRDTDPATFMRVVAGLVPKQLELKENPFEGISDDNINAIVALATAALDAAESGGGGAVH